MRGMQKTGALVVALLLVAGSRAEDRKPVVSDKIPTDQEFVAKALADHTQEIQLAEKARDKAANERVKKFAQRMVDDHTKARNELMDIVKEMKIAVATGETREFRELLVRLTRADGAEFDRAYMTHMVEDHEKAVNLFERYSEKGGNERLREYAKKTLPTVREHLKMARDIAGELKK